MNNTFTENKLSNLKSEKLDWEMVRADMKNKLGIDIYESWLKKIVFVEEFHNYVLLSVPTRFIRDWITSRYLDQILQSLKNHKKEIIRIEFKIDAQNLKNQQGDENFNQLKKTENISLNLIMVTGLFFHLLLIHNNKYQVKNKHNPNYR